MKAFQSEYYGVTGAKTPLLALHMQAFPIRTPRGLSKTFRDPGSHSGVKVRNL